MSAPPDDRVDVSALAAEGAAVARRYRIGEFPRLEGALAAPDGDVEAHFRFMQATPGIAGCELEVRADASLRCERCLEPFVAALQSSTRLAFTVGGQDAGELPDGLEELAVAAGRVSLRELVEDELLLSLPLVAKHGAGTRCAQGATPAPDAGSSAAPDRPRPFADLRELLKR